jgi:hypothetical protein
MVELLEKSNTDIIWEYENIVSKYKVELEEFLEKNKW